MKNLATNKLAILMSALALLGTPTMTAARGGWHGGGGGWHGGGWHRGGWGHWHGGSYVALGLYPGYYGGYYPYYSYPRR